MRTLRQLRAPGIAMTVLALAVSATVFGCGGKATTTTSAQTSGTASTEKPVGSENLPEAASRIPEGRTIQEGGGGPTQYTFREEWRRALTTATAWRAGAYLITATGDQINNEGIPSSWRLLFIDKDKPDALLMVDMDPWGKVTQQRELIGDDLKSFVSGYTKPIPFDVIDSDKMVGLGTAALAETVNLDKTKDPRVGLNYSETDGSGPYWVYTVFNTTSAEYVSARMDALTGKVAPAK